MALDDALALGAQACPECAADVTNVSAAPGSTPMAVFVYHEEGG